MTHRFPVVVGSPTPFARLEQAPDLGHLPRHRAREPRPRHHVVDHAQETVAQVELLDVAHARVPPSTASISNHACRARGTPCSRVTSMEPVDASTGSGSPLSP